MASTWCSLPLDDDATRELVARFLPDPDDAVVEQISALAAGIPFSIAELSRRAAEEPAWVQLLDATMIGGIPPATREVLQRVAVVGSSFDTDEFVALSGLPDDEAFDHLDAALAARVVEHASAGYRFRHGLVRDALLEDVPPHRRRRIHDDAAARLAELGASPARIGYHLLHAGDSGARRPLPPDARPTPRRRSARTVTRSTCSTPSGPTPPGPTGPGCSPCGPTC